jgi:hypothetical protein
MKAPEGNRAKLLDRWWVQLLLAVWVLAIVVIYFRLQVLRLLEIVTSGAG